MNFLYISARGAIYDIPLVLKSMGHSVTDLSHHAFDPLKPEYTEPLAPVEKALAEAPYDYVITYLYLSLVSDLCQKYQVPYIAWIYDSPLVAVFHESIYNSMNRIFVFDQAFYDRLIQIGVPHVYHMPLAANTTRINAHSFSHDDQSRFSHDISFVGTLYEGNAYNIFASKLSNEIKAPINQYLLEHLCNWKQIRQWPTLGEECTALFSSPQSPFYADVTQFQMPANLYLGILFYCRKLGEMERITALNTLAEEFQVDLYTKSQSPHIAMLNLHPKVGYYTQLGCVYHFSKINLNFTLPSIETGVPMRIFDIMAYGGFVLSNYQTEFSSMFQIGKDLAVFHDLDELKEQTRYYLSHEDERIAIAAHGYQTVNRFYSYEHQLTKILQICKESNK